MTENSRKDIEALVRLLKFAESEAQRLGLQNSARLVEVPAQSCVEEARQKFGLLIDSRLDSPGREEVRH